jgi:hypothetical protein
MWFASDIATCMYYTGIDPFTKQLVYVARNLQDRKLQRALMQFFKPENCFATASPTRQRARSLGSGACRTRATGRGGSRRAARTKTASEREAGQPRDPVSSTENEGAGSFSWNYK